MKVGFVLLAHEPPEQLRSLIEGLLAIGRNVFVHHHVTSQSDLRKASANWNLERFPGHLHLSPQIRVKWGEWSIVQATLNCLEAARQQGDDSDFYLLLSGSCMPIKPIKLVEAYLTATPWDHIEAVNAHQHRWVTQGIQEARWEKYHYFNWRKQQWLFDASLKVQNRLGVKRRLPLKQTPYMGSQWWCLRRGTVQKILDLVKQNSDVVGFYRRTWVPDELFFQTMVGNLVPPAEVVSRPLTRYQFNSWGVPRVYYDDDYPELLAEDRFVARKVSHRAAILREKLSAIAGMEIAEFESLLAKSNHERRALVDQIKMRDAVEANRWYSLACAHENQYEYIKSIPNPFVVVCGLNVATIQRALAQLDRFEETVVYGDLFISGGTETGGSCGVSNGLTTPPAEPFRNWDRKLGDIAFYATDKTVVFALGKDALHYLEVLRWKINVCILLVDEGRLDLHQRPVLSDLYFKSNVSAFIRDRYCAIARCSVTSLTQWIDNVLDQPLALNGLAERMPVRKSGEMWPSMLAALKKEKEFGKVINRRMIVFVTESDRAIGCAKEIMRQWFDKECYSSVFDIITAGIDPSAWQRYLADVLFSVAMSTEESCLCVTLPLGDSEHLESLRHNDGLLIVHLLDGNAYDEFSYSASGNAAFLRGMFEARKQLQVSLANGRCQYIKTVLEEASSIKGVLDGFILASSSRKKKKGELRKSAVPDALN